MDKVLPSVSRTLASHISDEQGLTSEEEAFPVEQEIFSAKKIRIKFII